MNVEERELVQGLAATMVEEIAPEETLMFSRTADTYFEDPDRLLAAQSGDDEPLGFGVVAAVALVAPVALAVATDVMKYLFEELKKRFADETTEGIVLLVKQLFSKTPDEESGTALAAEAVTLENDEIARVRSLAVEKATLLGLPTEKAQLLADALAGSLLGETI